MKWVYLLQYSVENPYHVELLVVALSHQNVALPSNPKGEGGLDVMLLFV